VPPPEVGPPYISQGQQCGHHPDSGQGTVDLLIDSTAFYDVPYNNTSKADKGNTFAAGTKFHVLFPPTAGGEETIQPSSDFNARLQATVLPNPTTDNVEMEPSLPGSFGSDFKKVFSFDSNQSFVENIANIQMNCPAVPRNLKEAINKLKRRAADKNITLPNAFNIREKRFDESGRSPSIKSANPRIEVHGGPNAAVKLTSEGGTGVVVDHGDVIMSGRINMNTSSPVRKMQGLGVEVAPMDNPPIQGPILAPHPKFLPSLDWILAIVPLALGVELAIDLVNEWRKV